MEKIIDTINVVDTTNDEMSVLSIILYALLGIFAVLIYAQIILPAPIYLLFRKRLVARIERKHGKGSIPSDRSFLTSPAIAGVAVAIVAFVSSLLKWEALPVVAFIAGVIYIIVSSIKKSKKMTFDSDEAKRWNLWTTLIISLSAGLLTIFLTFYLLFAVFLIFILYIILKYTVFSNNSGFTSSGGGYSNYFPDETSSDSTEKDSGYNDLDASTNGSDGSIVEGGSRTNLRDNGDGTMSGDNGALYKRDGNTVRRL